MILAVDIKVQVLRKEMAWQIKHAHISAKTLEKSLFVKRCGKKQTKNEYLSTLDLSGGSISILYDWLHLDVVVIFIIVVIFIFIFENVPDVALSFDLK